LDKELTEDWLNVGRRILGEEIAGKRVIKHEYLQSSLLEAIESEIIWESNEDRMRQLMKSSVVCEKKNLISLPIKSVMLQRLI
jgi:hypothetical protein